MPPPPPVPPPPPPVVNVGKGKIATQSSGDRGALLADIRQPKALKKTVTNDRSAPLVDANKSEINKLLCEKFYVRSFLIVLS